MYGGTETPRVFVITLVQYGARNEETGVTWCASVMPQQNADSGLKNVSAVSLLVLCCSWWCEPLSLVTRQCWQMPGALVSTRMGRG
jgi:hypothetical protein